MVGLAAESAPTRLAYQHNWHYTSDRPRPFIAAFLRCSPPCQSPATGRHKSGGRNIYQKTRQAKPAPVNKFRENQYTEFFPIESSPCAKKT